MAGVLGPKDAHPAMRQQAAAQVVGIMLALTVVAFAAVAEDQAGRLVRLDAFLLRADFDGAFHVADQGDDFQARLGPGIEAQRAIDADPVEALLVVPGGDGDAAFRGDDDTSAGAGHAALVPGFGIAPGAVGDGAMAGVAVAHQFEHGRVLFLLDRIAGVRLMVVVCRVRRLVVQGTQGPHPGTDQGAGERHDEQGQFQAGQSHGLLHSFSAVLRG